MAQVVHAGIVRETEDGLKLRDSAVIQCTILGPIFDSGFNPGSNQRGGLLAWEDNQVR